MANKVNFFAKASPTLRGENRRDYLLDPRYQLAQQLMRAGTATTPVQSNTEGIARALTGGLGGYYEGQARQDAEAREVAEIDEMGAILGGASDKPWTNPDTGEIAPGTEGGIKGMIRAGQGASTPGGLKMMRSLLGQDIARQQALSDAELARTQGLEDFEAKKRIEQKYAPPKTPKTVTTAEGVYTFGPEGLGERLGSPTGNTQNNISFPPGYRPTPEGGMEAIPGSPAAQKAAALEDKTTGRQRTRARAGTTVLQDIGRALELVETNWAASGPPAILASKVPGTDAYVASGHIQSALSNVGLDTLQAMRENSPTGGALGQVPIQQQKRLEQVLGSLEVGQPQEVLQDNLKRVHNIYMDIVYGAPDQIDDLVAEGKITEQEAAPIKQRYPLSFDDFGRPIQKPEFDIDALIEKYAPRR